MLSTRTRQSQTTAARGIRAPRWEDALDLVLPPLLALLTLLLRYPYRMGLPYAWDSILYIRAIDRFNPVIHQPQPPGYLLYVSAARLLGLVAHNPNAALVWVSMLAAAVAAAALYLLGRALYDRATGLIAALLLITSTTFWFYGEVAYPYTTLAAGTIVLALVALAVRRQWLPGWPGAAAAALLLGLLGGFRQDLLLFTAPLFLVAFWGRPPRDWLVALGAGTLGVLAWFLPTAALSGGIGTYLHATTHQAGMASNSTSVFSGGPAALWDNSRELGIFLFRGLYLALLPLLYQLARWAVRPRQEAAARRWLLLWLAPPLAVYLLVHIGDYGYTFSILPALLLIAARGVVSFASDGAGWVRGLRRWAPSTAALGLAAVLALGLTAGNSYVFLHHRSDLSAAGVLCADMEMQARLNLVHDHFAPDQTVILSSAYYQHVRYFLPNYRAWFYEPLVGSTESWSASSSRQLVVFDETFHPAVGQTSFQHYTLPCTGKPFYYTDLKPGDVVRFDHASNALAVERAP